MAIVSSLNEEEEVLVKNNSVLEITLSDAVKDYVPQSDNPFDMMFTNDQYQLSEILNAIENAKYDDNIKGISIENLMVNAGVAQIQSIRKKLLEFKESGKFITAFADLYTQKNYYLSSVADAVYVTPFGGVEFRGLSSERLFYKDFQDKYGVKMEVIRHGKYKSAVEGYLDNKMSDANREQTSALIHSLWDNILSAISDSRGISIAELNQAADKLSLDDPLKAVELKFVDGVKYSDEISDILKEKSSKGEDDDLEFISVKSYTKGAFYNEAKVAKDKIAVIYANGEIKGGKGDDTYIGELNIRKALIKAREDDRIKAIVLRVNSPGGSALVSDLIWREVVLTKEEKPVVVSMGNVAASGGYYISCAADYIFADPTTITGSIGVFGLIPNTGKFMTNKLGITFDEASTNENSNYITTNKALSPYQRGVIQNSVERVYDHFITKVANGRNMAKDDVDRIGQGRVWTGSQAIKIGLVDELGGLNSAIAKAAELSDIDNYKIKSLPYQKDPFQQIMEDMMGNSTSIAMKYYLGENYKYVQMFENMENRALIQARMPFDMIIE